MNDYDYEYDFNVMPFDAIVSGQAVYKVYDYTDNRERQTTFTIREKNSLIVCKNGLIFSAQVGEGNYGIPRIDNAAEYTAVEIGFPNRHIPELDSYMSGDPEEDDPTDSVYGFVPVDLIRKIIADNGGQTTDPVIYQLLAERGELRCSLEVTKQVSADRLHELTRMRTELMSVYSELDRLRDIETVDDEDEDEDCWEEE